MGFDYGRYFGEIKLAHDLLTTPDERSWRLTPPRDGERHDVVLYLGCNVLRTSHMVHADIDRALAAGATHIAGIYHGCHRELCRFETERPIVFEHYLTLFARALGIEFEDTYKKYMQWGDPDRILQDATPCLAANGVDAERARGLVIKTFAKSEERQP